MCACPERKDRQSRSRRNEGPCMLKGYGITPRVALEKLSKIYTPFKRMAIDIISPINSSSDAGHILILTLVDCAIRHAEAVVTFRKIDEETVAESLVNTYTRLDGPEEVLGDQGTQFMSDCMKEVLRVLGIKKKMRIPYHPIVMVW
ncbi:Zinc finger protein [Plakobranchus ocellatus]|uniref:Zinc finger protein n=1 Tax=Plakobranchus ocellatus TaxID=259542 RepID=A0AAV4CZA2_9GAST|nr:Zinc finger protein [Plakobranchus ocellatus]